MALMSSDFFKVFELSLLVLWEEVFPLLVVELRALLAPLQYGRHCGAYFRYTTSTSDHGAQVSRIML